MKTLLASLCTAALLALSSPGPAAAALVTFGATLSGSQEVPPVGSPGTGTGTLVADTVAQTLSVSESFAGLLGATVGGHIHAAPPGANGPIIIPFEDFPNGLTSGSYGGIFTAADLVNQGLSGISTFADLLAAMLAGNAYLNIHTALFPGGEIRGQIFPTSVPEPATLGLLGAALAGLALARTVRGRGGA